MIKRILVADDDRGTALLLARRLQKEGYEILTAADGLEALEMIMSERVDLLITDVVMPRMDGVDLYMELKNRPMTANLPVIFVTDKEVFQESFASLGVELYSPKPFNFGDLLGKITDIARKNVESRKYHKVVVIGLDNGLLNEMRDVLQEQNCIVVPVDKVVEIGLRCFLVAPKLILIDIFVHDYATTLEIIRSLRSYAFFAETVIVIYSNLSPEGVSKAGGMGHIDKEIQNCLEAGANKYIGRFERGSFLEKLKEYLV